MSQFAIGQSVVHPTHGAGEVIGIKKMDIIEEFNRYYVIEFLGKRLTLHIPVRKVDDNKIRKTMSKSKMKRVFEILRQIPGKLPDHFKARRKKVEDLINSGYPMKIAEAVRELTWREKSDRLNKIDTRLLSQGRGMLIEEIALVTDSETLEVQEKVDNALARAIEAKRNGAAPLPN